MQLHKTIYILINAQAEKAMKLNMKAFGVTLMAKINKSNPITKIIVLMRSTELGYSPPLNTHY